MPNRVQTLQGVRHMSGLERNLIPLDRVRDYGDKEKSVQLLQVSSEVMELQG